ncbi:trypsin-like serine protease [Streptomyces sp. NPDC052000]|uniref:trypsin-like serine protease n=1 Tax=Streptomyces sp. NPDC052000 TaxID=3155676 RepID=UPI00344ED63A
MGNAAAHSLGKIEPCLPGQFLCQVQFQENAQHFCGGTIISECHVATAAHCISDGSGRLSNPARRRGIDTTSTISTFRHGR